MSNTYTAVIKQDGKHWIGWIEEISGVNCQAESRDELLDTLQVTLAEAIQLNRESALQEAPEGYEEQKVTV
jgi:predicted RNase H-like HicB family nuclease